MPVYRVAVIIAGIDQSYQSEILNGISASAKESSINVEAFISFIGSMYMTPESLIYSTYRTSATMTERYSLRIR